MTEEQDKQPSVRPAGRADVDVIALIEGMSFHTVDEIFTPAQVLRLIRNPNANTLVLERGGEVVGWCAALRRKTLRGITGRLYTIVIHPGARGMGFGEVLCRGVIERLRTDRCTRLYLEVRTTNATAIRLYRRLGFTIVRSMADYYSEGVHAYSMQLEMPESGSGSVGVLTRAG